MSSTEEEGLIFALAVDEILQFNNMMINNLLADKAEILKIVYCLYIPFPYDRKLKTSRSGTFFKVFSI